MVLILNFPLLQEIETANQSNSSRPNGQVPVNKPSGNFKPDFPKTEVKKPYHSYHDDSDDVSIVTATWGKIFATWICEITFNSSYTVELFCLVGMVRIFKIKCNSIPEHIVFIFTNSADPDEMLHYAAFHEGLHCLSKYPFRGFPFSKG